MAINTHGTVEIPQHLNFTRTLLSVTFHNTCHPEDNIDSSKENATQTSSCNTRREVVTGHAPPSQATNDFNLFFMVSQLNCIDIYNKVNLFIPGPIIEPWGTLVLDVILIGQI